MNCNIDFLITTCNKTNNDIKSIISGMAINGNFIIRNQISFIDHRDVNLIEFNNPNVKVIFSNDKGLSKNRNELLKQSNADFVIFCDDDVSFLKDFDPQKEIDALSKYDCVIYNALSQNKDRQFIQHKKAKKCKSFFDLSHNGIHGAFFKRQFLIDNNITFDENIGSGTGLPCGEDSVFLKEVLDKKGKIYISNKSAVLVKQQDSLWYKNTIDESVLIAKGYCYRKIYHSLWRLFSIRFIHKERHRITTKHPFDFLKKGALLAQGSNNKK